MSGFFAKLNMGAGFRGILKYALENRDGELRGEICGSNMAGENDRELSAEFAIARRLHTTAKSPVLHVSLSLPAGSRELTPEEWDRAARVWLKQYGVDPDTHQYVAVQHRDTEHPHIHIIASRISLTGKLARDPRQNYLVAKQAAGEASRALGLAPLGAAEPHLRPPIIKGPDRRELEVGKTPLRLQIAARLDTALAMSADWTSFKARAADLGIEVREASNAGGVYGVSFATADKAFKGSQIGKAYTYSSLLKRLDHAGVDVAAGSELRPRRDILERLRAEKTSSGTVYRWDNGHAAVFDLGQGLGWRTGSTAEAAALAAVASSKGWGSVKLADRGDQQKNDAAWLAYMRAGVDVVGYQPTPAVLAQLKEIQDGKRNTAYEIQAQPRRAGEADRRPAGRAADDLPAPLGDHTCGTAASRSEPSHGAARSTAEDFGRPSGAQPVDEAGNPRASGYDPRAAEAPGATGKPVSSTEAESPRPSPTQPTAEARPVGTPDRNTVLEGAAKALSADEEARLRLFVLDRLGRFVRSTPRAAYGAEDRARRDLAERLDQLKHADQDRRELLILLTGHLASGTKPRDDQEHLVTLTRPLEEAQVQRAVQIAQPPKPTPKPTGPKQQTPGMSM